MSERPQRARDRRTQRQQRQREMVRRVGSPAQIKPANSRELPSFSLPSWWRVALFIPLGIGTVLGVIALLGILNPPEVNLTPNAIWLNERWSHQGREDSELITLNTQLEQNAVGTVYVYVSSLRPNNVWSGNPNEDNVFDEISDNLRGFLERWRRIAPNTEVLAWVEVLATTNDGYRLDDDNIQRIVADFARLLVEDYGFDGVMLDVKPVFDGNMDFLRLIRGVRAGIGLNTPLAVVMPPDFTPTDAGINIPTVIAPDTVFSEEYKQRVALQADMLIITAYNSYLSNPVDYIEWVRYQVQAFTSAISQIDSGAQILISVPNYADRPPAHLSAIESMAGSLDGVGRGYRSLSTEEATLIQGVALFTDRDLREEDWRIFRDKWLALR